MSFREVADIVMHASEAEQTEVILVDRDESLTRFANNSIHQNVAERNTQVLIRAVTGHRVGIAGGNELRRESLERLTARALELARLQPENPEFHGLPQPRPIPDVAAYDEATAHCSAAERALRAGVVCRKAATAGYTAAGSLTTSTSTIGVANSLGVFAETKTSGVDVSMVMMASDSSGWAQASDWHIDAIDTESYADEAIRKARLGASPVEFQPGEYPVILDAYAVADVVGMLAFDGLGALAVQEERSWLNGRIGRKIMADSVTIVDNGLDPAGIPMPFDFEGVPKQPVVLVDAGVAKGPVYDSFTAGRESGRQSTGHALPPSASDHYGPLPLNLFMRPGSSSVEEMIRSTKLGLYITRFWYTRTVHPRDAVITGMTRDGTFVVRDGEIAYPVKSMRFTQSYVEALKNTEAIGSVPRLMKSIALCSVPALKIGQFRFTSGTR